MLEFSIAISSLFSKFEGRKLVWALDSCFVLFGTFQQCEPTEAGGNWTRDFTVRKPISTWVPLYQKCNLITSVSARVFKICSPDVIDQELTLFRTILHQNGYPDKFINKHLRAPSPKKEQTVVPKKHLFLTLPFKTDADSELLGNHLRRAIKRIYHAADLRLTFSNSPMLSTCVKGKQRKEAISMCICEFTCLCGATYIGRTKRRLSMRTREHLLTWFCKGEIRSLISSVLEHLLQTDHTADPDKWFKLIQTIKPQVYLPRKSMSKLFYPHGFDGKCFIKNFISFEFLGYND